MKKLIISAITAAALLFGFAGCSGDLHDDEKRIIDLSAGGAPGDFDEPANWSEKEPWTTSDVKTGTYTLSFKTKAEIPADGVGFKINSQLAWNVDGYTEFTVAADGDAATAKFMTGKAMAGAGNAFITGCKPSTAYKMTVVCNPDTTATVKVETANSASPAESAPVPYYLDGMYLVGGVFKLDGKDNAFAFSTENLIWGASTNKKTGVVTYTKDIKAIAASGELGINDSSWNNKQLGVGVTIAAGAEEAVALNGTAGNFNVTGLTVGKPYRVEISTTPEKVISIKIYEIAEVTLSFKVKGLNEGDSAWINGSIWGDGWPQGWPIKGWNDNDAEKTTGFISAHPAAVADASGVATFDAKWNKTFISKIGDTKSWECKVVYIADGASWDDKDAVKDSGENLKFDYDVTAGGSYTFVIDAANGWEISVE